MGWGIEVLDGSTTLCSVVVIEGGAVAIPRGDAASQDAKVLCPM